MTASEDRRALEHKQQLEVRAAQAIAADQAERAEQQRRERLLIGASDDELRVERARAAVVAVMSGSWSWTAFDTSWSASMDEVERLAKRVAADAVRTALEPRLRELEQAAEIAARQRQRELAEIPDRSGRPAHGPRL